jgi:hypothetical protein
MNTIENLIAELSAWASSNPGCTPSFQLRDGTEFLLDPENEPYGYGRVIVIPIVEPERGTAG